MARFVSLSDSDLDQILEDHDSKNTKSVIKLAVKVLNEYLIEKNGEIASVNELDLSDTSVDIVVATLKRFYGEIRKADGTLYAKKSMITLRFGLQKHFLKSRKEDIINSEHYSAAYDMFKAVMVKLVKEGKGTVKHKEVILPEDLQKLYGHFNFSRETPEVLQNRVFFEYLYYFCNRGRENLRDVQKEDFELKVDGQGRRYITLKFQLQTKNHRGDNLTDVDMKDGRRYEMPRDEKCPVSSFIKNFSKLNPGSDNYWQRPKLIYNETDDVWYDNVAVGKNTLGGMMAKISQVCNLSKRYTNHCVRSTCITALDDSGYETRHIMRLSGHKSESAVRAYSKRLSEKKTREMSDILSATVQVTGNDESRNSFTSTNTSASTKCHVSDFKSFYINMYFSSCWSSAT